MTKEEEGGGGVVWTDLTSSGKKRLWCGAIGGKVWRQEDKLGRC